MRIREIPQNDPEFLQALINYGLLNMQHLTDLADINLKPEHQEAGKVQKVALFADTMETSRLCQVSVYSEGGKHRAVLENVPERTLDEQAAIEVLTPGVRVVNVERRQKAVPVVQLLLDPQRLRALVQELSTILPSCLDADARLKLLREKKCSAGAVYAKAVSPKGNRDLNTKAEVEAFLEEKHEVLGTLEKDEVQARKECDMVHARLFSAASRLRDIWLAEPALAEINLPKSKDSAGLLEALRSLLEGQVTKTCSDIIMTLDGASMPSAVSLELRKRINTNAWSPELHVDVAVTKDVVKSVKVDLWAEMRNDSGSDWDDVELVLNTGNKAAVGSTPAERRMVFLPRTHGKFTKTSYHHHESEANDSPDSEPQQDLSASNRVTRGTSVRAGQAAKVFVGSVTLDKPASTVVCNLGRESSAVTTLIHGRNDSTIELPGGESFVRINGELEAHGLQQNCPPKANFFTTLRKSGAVTVASSPTQSKITKDQAGFWSNKKVARFTTRYTLKSSASSPTMVATLYSLPKSEHVDNPIVLMEPNPSKLVSVEAETDEEAVLLGLARIQNSSTFVNTRTNTLINFVKLKAGEVKHQQFVYAAEHTGVSFKTLIGS
ncbi:MAG: uncharacterized protein KVP18_002093 [Porospora cf. gigantea A]|uniref:uncharacterized protein n=1 Tax=Porospora cf. gigantea A TaxID=2853593 RepID=UPI003559F3E3|nr:MAG: hypothetical protein KVP18_002093 [Porospora cf. gigantea A]